MAAALGIKKGEKDIFTNHLHSQKGLLSVNNRR